MFAPTPVKRFFQMNKPLIDQTNSESRAGYCGHRWTFRIFLIVTVGIFIFNIVSCIGFHDLTSSSVDDLYLPQSLRCPHKNKTRLEYGRLHLARSRVIICGLIRDREAHISRIRQQIEEITQLFDDYAIVIVENDSKDRTRQQLIAWAQDKKVAGRIHVIGCNNQVNDDRPCNLSLAPTPTNHPPTMSRIEKMVLLRNMYMQYIEDNAQLAQFDHTHTGIIQVFNSSNFNETEINESLVNNNNDNETTLNDNQSSIQIVDKNQFAETVVDLLLDLLEKANLSRTVSIIHNDTELTELVEQDDVDLQTTTIKLTDP
ncbi:unnamed protein product [Rotaria sordida]|uniref:Uncharacterized protein n=2 Tax=Rotaria sordida TaxID=392033 RepID=A0A814AYC9_9BILA|nr:unnamed protein product [Rotaria sordida]CAF3852602.1 unnamed protein product [Rotaria sordida]